MRPPDISCLLAALLLVVVCLVSCLPPGKKLLRAEYRREDKLVLTTAFDAPDYESNAELCGRLGVAPLWTKKELSDAKLSDDSLGARLEGPVEIRVFHTDSELIRASVEGLLLVRDSVDESRWYLPARELERVRQAAGL